MKNFKELFIWQKAIELVVLVYDATKNFPDIEKFGLTIQMRRAAISMPSNIAEGHMRSTNKDFKHFISISRGSCAELETQGYIARDLGYLKQDNFCLLMNKIEELAKMLTAFRSKL